MRGDYDDARRGRIGAEISMRTPSWFDGRTLRVLLTMRAWRELKTLREPSS
jgi:hypothetical protein